MERGKNGGARRCAAREAHLQVGAEWLAITDPSVSSRLVGRANCGLHPDLGHKVELASGRLRLHEPLSQVLQVGRWTVQPDPSVQAHAPASATVDG